MRGTPMTTEAVRLRVGWRATQMTRTRDGVFECFTIVSRQKPVVTILAGLPVAFLAIATIVYASSHLDIVTAVFVGLLGYMLYEMAKANFGATVVRLGQEIEARSMLVLPWIGAVPVAPAFRLSLAEITTVSLLQTEYGKAKSKPVDWPGYGLEVRSGDDTRQRLISGVTLEQAEELRLAVRKRMDQEPA